MRNNKNNNDELNDIEEYEENDYKKFNEIEEMSEEEEIKENLKEEKKEEHFILNPKNLKKLFLLLEKWFERVGIMIAIILIAYFITQGRLIDLFLYIMLLVGSFFIGFLLMYFYTKFIKRN